MQLYIIRHAQSKNNELYASQETWDGRTPDPLLSEAGRQQAGVLASFMARSDLHQEADDLDVNNQRGFRITHLYTSLLQRALLTALPLSEAIKIPAVACEPIHEIGGVFEIVDDFDNRKGLPGPNRAFFEKNYPSVVLPDSLGDDGWWNRPYEQREMSIYRARLFWVELMARHGQSGDRVAMVTHAGFFQTLMNLVLDYTRLNQVGDMEKYIWFAMNNASITRLDVMEDRIRLVYLNRLDHMPAELIT
jgi:2,3-bisphosphoglycerate-dependent phosphoglycerate mutase